LKLPLKAESFNNPPYEKSDDILTVIKKIAPVHYSFISSKFGNFKKGTQEDFVRLIFDLCFLVFLKNSKSFEDFCPKKVL
jgi:hypothetical protein